MKIYRNGAILSIPDINDSPLVFLRGREGGTNAHKVLKKMESGGMSGCIYGPMLPVIGELYHFTMSGVFKGKYPVLVDPEKVEKLKIRELLGPEDVRGLSVNDMNAVFFQILVVYGAQVAQKIAEQLPFSLNYSLYRIYTTRMIYHIWNTPWGVVRYKRLPFPEKPCIELPVANLTIPAPRVSGKKINTSLHVFPDVMGMATPVQRISLHSASRQWDFYISQPPGRGLVVYRLARHGKEGPEFLTGWEVFGKENHVPADIVIPVWKEDYLTDLYIWLLITNRLGDLLFLSQSSIELLEQNGLPLLEAEDEQLEKVVRIENGDHVTYFHPEHGAITVPKNFKIYSVFYRRRGHD